MSRVFQVAEVFQKLCFKGSEMWGVSEISYCFTSTWVKIENLEYHIGLILDTRYFSLDGSPNYHLDLVLE